MRPFLRATAEDLDELAQEHWGDVSVLVAVIVELFRRRTDYARSLRGELVVRARELVLEQGFQWPTTDAPGGSGDLEPEWPSAGLLSYLDYHVGTNGLPRPERREILDAVYCGDLPPVNSSTYMAEWGKPRTAARLQKLAESIAAFARNTKRRRAANVTDAVDDWESDLDYLKRTYYVGRYDFPWPGTDLSGRTTHT